ncbi:hypothetical protein GTY41_38315 [Streptomyces sp. SID685]|uniref:hypothetical protein n=1 Tax=Streptomyces sp. SID685 TaxID=2690322 RepID=UPI001370F707|nr:hypothetical protein [Streptomyces sp. SID685]MYR90617.1 hypothetical protein [Streptomyces sp. SID685]
MSRKRHAAGGRTPAPHRLTGTETAVIIVIVLTSVALAWGGMDPGTVQLFAGAGLIAVGAVVTLRFGRRVPLSLPIV